MQHRGNTYPIDGLRIRSEIPLPEFACDDEGVVGVEVTLAEFSTIPDEAPLGTVPAIRDRDLGGYTIAEDEAGYIVRFYCTYDFRISRDLRSIRVHVRRASTTASSP